MRTSIPENVVARLAYKRQISLHVADCVFLDLEDFLFQASTRSQIPSEMLDAAWHEFILHTNEYAHYCYSRFGKFIHHVPTSPMSCKTDDDENEPKCRSGLVIKHSQVNEANEKCSSCTNCRSEIVA